MTRTLLAIALLALLASPLAVAQHGPPPGYTDPVAYAEDYAKDQAGQAQADPVGYAQGKDAMGEAEHTAWLACWALYDTVGHVTDPACAPFFTAPVQVNPAAEAVTGEITEVLNATGADALAGEVLDAVNDTVADPKSVLDQVQRIVDAVVSFVEDLIDFVLDVLGLAGLGIAGGLLGAVQGLVDLVALPVDGLSLAASGLGDALDLVGSAATQVVDTAMSTLDAVALGVSGVSLTASQVTDDAATTTLGQLRAAADGAEHAIRDVNAGVQDGLQSAAQGIERASKATASAVAQTAQTIQDTVADAAHKLGSLFGGKSSDAPASPSGDLDAPKTGTGADGLLDRILGKL